MGNSKSSDSPPESLTSSTSYSTSTTPRSQGHLYGLANPELPQMVHYLSSTSSSSSVSPTATQSRGTYRYPNQAAQEPRRDTPLTLNTPVAARVRETVGYRHRLGEQSQNFSSAISANSVKQINPYSISTQSNSHQQNDHLLMRKDIKAAPVKTDPTKTPTQLNLGPQNDNFLTNKNTKASSVNTDPTKMISPSSATVIYESQLRARSQNSSSQNMDVASSTQSSAVKSYQHQLEVKSQTQPLHPLSTEIESASKLFAMQLSLKSQNQLDDLMSSNMKQFSTESKSSNSESNSLVLNEPKIPNLAIANEENNLDKMTVSESVTPSDSDNILWGTRSSDEEDASVSEDEATATLTSPMDLFKALMPKATSGNKEIITLSSGQAIFNEKENHLRRMLNSTFLLEYLADYIIKKAATVMKVYLKDIADIEGKCHKSFIRVLQYYPGFTFEDKLMDFIESFNYVFIVDEQNNKQISVDLTAKNYVDEAYARLVKELVLFCIEEGNKDIDGVSKYVRDMFQQEPFSRYANVTTDQLVLLISKFPNELHVDRHQQVHIVENLSVEPNNQITETKSAQSEVVAFFTKELQSIPDGLFFKDLPRVLSWKKPELLANLTGRNARSIFNILAANSLFEATDNYICLKSAKMKKNQKNIIQYDNTFLKSLAETKNYYSKPKTYGMAQYDAYMGNVESVKPTKVVEKIVTLPKAENFDDDTSVCCIIGTVFSLNSVQGSLWCAPGSNSKTVFVLCTLKTVINGNQVSDLKHVLQVGQKVVFSASSSCIGGLVKWTALHVKTFLDSTFTSFCSTCMKIKSASNTSTTTNLTNGIALDSKNLFFWNVLGKVVAIGNLFMTVACKLSRKSTKQNMNVFCDGATLLLDAEGNMLNDFTHFAIDQTVECDIIIISVNNELVWAATEVRKYPINYARLYQNPKIAYNCEGMVKYHQLGIGRIIVMKSQTNKSIECEIASYKRSKVWFLKNDFPSDSFDNRLKALDKVIFDAVQGADGKWEAYLIRKTLRPIPNLPDPQASPLIGENTIEKLQGLHEFHIAEMNDVKNSLNKPFDLKSKFPFDLDNLNNNSAKLSSATQTISTGPIVTVLGSVQSTL